MKLIFNLLFISILVSGVLRGVSSQLREEYYKESCPEAEKIVRQITWDHVSRNPVLPAKLLRMHFHDCFVRGCDGSILLNSTVDRTAEKDSIPNKFLSGYDVIDAIKEKLETECTGTVSCSDILALAARDSISFQKQMWKVLTGRRDGIVSLDFEALQIIPKPFQNFTELEQTFASKGLSVHDLSVLSGAHTIGAGHCTLILKRLYNFTGKGDQDPALDPTYAEFLRSKCPQNVDKSVTVEMDLNSSFNFDNSYYVGLQHQKGLFQSDAALLTNKVAFDTVKELAKEGKFLTEFGLSMKRLGEIEVLTGSDGEIRTKCWVVNS
ncbi:hypothetical protein UlMin_016856 [Ulmus minor]